ncbi:hypothetical protein D3C72_2165700 [compost metagenome]
MSEHTTLRNNAVCHKGLYCLGILRRHADLLLKGFKCLEDIDADIFLFKTQRRLRTQQVNRVEIRWHIDDNIL